MSFKIKNPTNESIRVLEMSSRSEQNGIITHEDADFLIPARDYYGTILYGDFHKNSQICILGRLSDGTNFGEIREVEITANADDEVGVLMGLLELNVRLIEQKFQASKEPLSCFQI